MMRLEDVLSEDKIPATEVERQYYFIDVAKQILEDKEKEAGRKLTFCVNTFGCQVNARDSEKLIGILEQVGYVQADSEDADFVLYNTCTVRENANNKVYGHLGYLHNKKKKNPHMMIALCGCMMQEEQWLRPSARNIVLSIWSLVHIIFTNSQNFWCGRFYPSL